MGALAAAVPATGIQSYQRLRRLLDELFQFDQADLDFGIYRIMNQKRAEIGRFLDTDLLPQVQATLADFRAGEQDALRSELDKLRATLQAAGVNPETAPRYQELQNQLTALGSGPELENEVYSDLYTFFRRYYKEGDFLSLRRYKAGVYAIPYEGEEVKLHWANADQYYVKTTEAFQDYRFRLPDGRHVHFRLMAAEIERDNNKATDEERRFVLREEEPVQEIDGELHIRFEYRPSKEKQKDLNGQAVEALLGLPILRGWREALATLHPTAGNGNRTLLAKHIADYTAKNTFDYFIHKDLGGFLRRELDFFLKNEVLHVDDLDTDDEQRADQYLARLRAIKRIGGKLISFLAQLEDFQKRLFLKKKFVLAAEYCVTLDRVPTDLYDQILANERQWVEWERLFAVSELPDAGDRAAVLRGNPFLVLDTCFFAAGFKQSLLESIDDLEAEIDGVLIKAENFQALSLLHERYRGQAKCIYIDPPYNTGPTEILYKNNYKHSSWLSLMENRMSVSKGLLGEDSVYVIAIDDAEMIRISELSDQLFPDRERNMVIVNHHPQGAGGANISRTHEYALVLTPKDEDLLRGRERGEYVENRPYMRSGTAENNFRYGRPNSFYALLIDPVDKQVVGIEPPPGRDEPYPREDTPEGWVRKYPLSQNGSERVWRQSYESARAAVEAGRIIASAEHAVYQVIDHRVKRTTLFSNWTDKRYNAGTQGTNLISGILGKTGEFSYPKSLYTVMDIVDASTYDVEEPLTIDFFAGSGTTAHAVIGLNRDDGGKRRYVLVEMGEYFDTVLKPRIQRVIYSKDWKDGRPVSREGSSQLIKYLALESYEDTLNNLRLRERSAAQRQLLERTANLREDYLVSYCLDAETDGSASLLDLERFETPFDYRLTVTQGGESRSVAIDLPETFNYLLGLRVQRVRTLESFYTIEGIDPHGRRVLVIWRSLKDAGTDNEALEHFFTAQGYAGRPPEEALDRIYINGDNSLLNLRPEGASWQVLLIEQEFGRLMFTAPGEGGL